VAIRNPSPVGRPGGIEIRRRIMGQAREAGAVGIDGVDIPVLIPHRERNTSRWRVRGAGRRQPRDGGEGESKNCETSHHLLATSTRLYTASRVPVPSRAR
jgi:hypothetical protein